jgi:fatty-acyl-CoA synthase
MMKSCRTQQLPRSNPMARPSPYDQDLERNAANYAPLTPLSLIARTAYTYPERTSVIHGDSRYTWAETYTRSRRLASALVRPASARAIRSR